MSNIHSHRDLDVWHKAMNPVCEVYELSAAFPSTEVYGLTAQLRRAAVSIPANIAEGRARATRRDFAHFLSIAKGSLMETETLLQIAVRLKYLSEESIKPQLSVIEEISKMLTALHAKLISRSV